MRAKPAREVLRALRIGALLEPRRSHPAHGQGADHRQGAYSDPTKAIWVSNSNSLIGNARGHYETVANTLPRVDMVIVNEWWWTASCEYADIVFPIDSWAEFKHPMSRPA